MTPGDTIDVLHVDDDAEFVDLTATFLEREHDGIAVQTATSPAEGLSVLGQADIDCVVSDYEMPRTNGIEFLETVRETYPSLPFILFTGRGSEEIASEAISAGVTDYLQKEGGTDQYAILANRIGNAVAQVRAEREVERTQEYYGTILEHASDYVTIVDEDRRVQYVSPAVERVLGYEREEIEDADAFDPIHPDDVSVAEDAFVTLSDDPETELTVEFRARHADGSLRWLEARGRNLMDDPVIGGIVVTSRDITEKRRSRHELESIVDNLPGYVYRHRYESGWPLEFVKGSAESVTGYTTTELEEDISLAEKIIHTEDREAVWKGVKDGLDANGHFDLTYRITTKDGDEQWIRDQGQLVEDPTTGEEFLDGFIVDVTDHKERERELRQQKRRCEAIFHDPNIFVGLVDTDGTVRDVNQTALEYTTASLDSIQDEPFWETAWFDHSPAVRERIADAIEHAADGEYVERTLELIRPDGTPYTVEAVFRPVRNDQGEVVSVIVSGRDIIEE